MAYPRLHGTRVGRIPDPDDLPKGHHPCARCGRVREARAETVLCQDCMSTLTPEERALWLTKNAA